jgi:Ca2+-binding RTX toxin-like protein
VTAPANGTTVSGSSVAVSANASDNVGVSGVQFKLDGANLGAEDTTSPYSITWNSTTATNGSHTLTAVARDAAGKTTTSPGVSVTVKNTGASPLPDVIVTSLSYASGVFTSTVKNQGTAATPAGIAIGVGYSVDGVYRTWGAVASPPLAAGQSATVGTNGGPYTIPNGTHTITANVDDVNRFAESDETNNQLSQPITVGGINSQPTPNPAPPTCRGQVANISVFNNTIFGGPDSGTPYTGTLRGTNGNDVIVGTDANDSINGAGGDDIICGGAGGDTLRGGKGNDRLFGESGNDRLFGGPGRDLCNGGKGRNKVSGCERLK